MIKDYDNFFLPVNDLEKAKAFYTEVLQLPIKFDFSERGIAGFKVGKQEPATILKNKNKFVEAKPTIWFEVENLQDAVAQMKEKGVEFLSEPFRINKGWAVEFEDPFGNRLGLTQYTDHDLTIRAMGEEDIGSLTETFCFPWTTKQATREKWKRYYVEQQNHARTVYLLEAQNQLIGYGSLLRISEYPSFKEKGIPEINDVWIHEEMCNQGFGQKLIASLENMARKVGYKKVGIGVGLYKDYGAAQRLYVQMGYIPDGMGVRYKSSYVTPGEQYLMDDDLILWMKKTL